MLHRESRQRYSRLTGDSGSLSHSSEVMVGCPSMAKSSSQNFRRQLLRGVLLALHLFPVSRQNVVKAFVISFIEWHVCGLRRTFPTATQQQFQRSSLLHQQMHISKEKILILAHCNKICTTLRSHISMLCRSITCS